MGKKPAKTGKKSGQTQSQGKEPVKKVSAKKPHVKAGKTAARPSQTSQADSRILDHLPKAALVLDAKSLKIVDCNRAACELYGLSATQLKARDLPSLTIPSEQTLAGLWLH